MDFRAIARALRDPENQPHQWNDQDLAAFFVFAADQIERLQEEHHDVRILNEQYCNENAILTDEIERLREALRFYADRNHKSDDGDCIESGQTARSALQQKESE